MAIDPNILANSGLAATGFSADDYNWAFFTKNSGLTPAKDYAITSHKIAYFQRMLNSTSKHIDNLNREWTLSGKSYANYISVLLDSFDRADSASSLGTASDGGTWTVQGGTWGISGNQAYDVSGSGAQAVRDVGKSDMYVQTKVTGAIALVARVQSYTTWYGLTSDGSALQLYRFVSGNPVNIASPGAVANGDTVRLEVVGTTVTVKRNGTVVTSITDTGITTGTFGGMRSDSTAARFDDFAAGPL